MDYNRDIRRKVLDELTKLLRSEREPILLTSDSVQAFEKLYSDNRLDSIKFSEKVDKIQDIIYSNPKVFRRLANASDETISEICKYYLTQACLRYDDPKEGVVTIVKQNLLELPQTI